MKKFFLHKNCYYKCSSTKIKKKFFYLKKEDLDKAFSISVSSPFVLFKNLIIKAIEKNIL